MTGRGWAWWLLLIVSVSTFLSGVIQLAAPALVLGVVAAGTAPEAKHFFGIVGMFMALFGGLLTQALLDPDPSALVLLWAGLQKFGAAAAVAVGVARGIFGPLALAIAAFDFLSGVLIFYYRASAGKGGTAKWTSQSAR